MVSDSKGQKVAGNQSGWWVGSWRRRGVWKAGCLGCLVGDLGSRQTGGRWGGAWEQLCRGRLVGVLVGLG